MAEQTTKEAEVTVIDMRPILGGTKGKLATINCPLCRRSTTLQTQSPMTCISSHINTFHTISSKPIAVLLDWERSFYTNWRHNRGYKMPIPRETKEKLGLQKSKKQ